MCEFRCGKKCRHRIALHAVHLQDRPVHDTSTPCSLSLLSKVPCTPSHCPAHSLPTDTQTTPHRRQSTTGHTVHSRHTVTYKATSVGRSLISSQRLRFDLVDAACLRIQGSSSSADNHPNLGHQSLHTLKASKCTFDVHHSGYSTVAVSSSEVVQHLPRPRFPSQPD